MITQERLFLEQGDNYTIQQSHDRFAGMDYVECWGQLDEEHYFIIRTPLESIRESADISNKFYFAVGLMIIILSGLVIMVVTRRITRPISELTELSRKMSDLDFEAKYESKVGNGSFQFMGHVIQKFLSHLVDLDLVLNVTLQFIICRFQFTDGSLQL